MLKDQKELLYEFNKHGVKYLVVGGHAVGFHAEPRGTKDLDVFIKSDVQNSEAVYRALQDFGAPLADVAAADFQGQPDTVFQIGVPPARVDILQSISGVEFDDAWERRIERRIDPQTAVYVISREDLIRNKIASGRGIDLVDVEKIRESPFGEKD